MATTRRTLAAGELVFREGDPPTTAFLIESGAIRVHTERGGERVVLGELGPGDLLGEMAIIDASPRSATAEAVMPTLLIAVDQTQIQERLESADPVIRALLRSQLRRYRSALATFRGDDAEPAHGSPIRSLSVPDARTDSLDDDAIAKIRLETQLKESLQHRALEVRFQPIWEIATARIAGYEALIRWEHPTRGPVSPAEFIRLAEETSLIVPVGRYVFETVCEALAGLQGRGHSPLPFVAVNVSARQTEEESLLDDVVRLAEARGIPAAAIKIEITESLTLDRERVASLIERCHRRGLKVALDDFGTGNSNLGHLHTLRFDTVKLDQGFVRQMLDAPRCFAIVRAIVAMVEALGADIVAEGVETREQLEALRQLGVRYAQGWVIGKARAADELHLPVTL